jgi:hypothetical protein
VEEERSHRWVSGQADCAVVGVCGLTRLPETLEKMGANRPVRLIMGQGL